MIEITILCLIHKVRTLATKPPDMHGSEQVFGAPAANIARSADPATLKTVVRGSDQIARGLVSTENGLGE